MTPDECMKDGKCPICEGRGEVSIPRLCLSCSGSGAYPPPKDLVVLEGDDERLTPLREWHRTQWDRAMRTWGVLGPQIAQLEADLDRRHLTYRLAAYIGVELRRMGAPNLDPPLDCLLPAARAAVSELLGAEA